MDIALNDALSNLSNAEYDANWAQAEYDLRVSEIARLKEEIALLEKEEFMFKQKAFEYRMTLLSALTECQNHRSKIDDVDTMHVYETITKRCAETIAKK
jgi:hypothetical protein